MILSLDFDAFYCGVEVHKDPSLKDVPFVISQKNICATCSYSARALGIKKLEPMYRIRAQFPDIKVINGEDLTEYKHEGRRIFELVRDHFLPGCPIERLGLEEIRVDISESVNWNKRKLGLSSIQDITEIIQDGFDNLSPDGIELSLTPGGLRFECPELFFKPAGNVWTTGPWKENLKLKSAEMEYLYEAKTGLAEQSLDLLIASFIAENIMDRLWLEEKYKVSIGVGSTVTMAKMICGDSKPNGLTIIHPKNNQGYLDVRPVAKIPGFGRAVVAGLSEYLAGIPDVTENELEHMLVETLRTRLSQKDFEDLFGLNKGNSLWSLLFGKRLPSEIPTIQHSIPKRISVEDTFTRGTLHDAHKCLEILAERLISQIKDSCMNEDFLTWTAQPRTLQFQLRQTPDGREGRRSKSVPLRTFDIERDDIMNRIKPLFKSLYIPHQDIRLVNISVAGIEPIDQL